MTGVRDERRGIMGRHMYNLAASSLCWICTYCHIVIFYSISVRPGESKLGLQDRNSKCRSILKSLEQQFDARRFARRTYARDVAGKAQLKQLDFFEGNLVYTDNHFDIFEPEANCITEERIGGRSGLDRYMAYGDGPKFVCGMDMLKAAGGNCLVYSLGSNNQIDYEIAIKKHLGCEIHTFDPTLSTPFVGSKYAEFHPWGVGRDNVTMEENSKIFDTFGIDTIIKKLDHKGRKIDMIKMDIEDAEWVALPDLFKEIEKGTVIVDQIQVELHESDFQQTLNLFELADDAKMRVMHKERNGWGCGGTRCIEYSFVSETFLESHHAWLFCGESNKAAKHKVHD